MGLFGLVVGGSQLSQAKSAKKNAVTQKQIAENTATQAAAEIIKAAALKEANDIELAKLTPEQQAPILEARALKARLEAEAQSRALDKKQHERKLAATMFAWFLIVVGSFVIALFTAGISLIIEVVAIVAYVIIKKHKSTAQDSQDKGDN